LPFTRTGLTDEGRSPECGTVGRHRKHLTKSPGSSAITWGKNASNAIAWACIATAFPLGLLGTQGSPEQQCHHAVCHRQSGRVHILKAGLQFDGSFRQFQIDLCVPVQNDVSEKGVNGFRSSENGYGCVSFLAARIPAAAVSCSHMYAPRFVFP
jgi:hypothetical protein